MTKNEIKLQIAVLSFFAKERKTVLNRSAITNVNEDISSNRNEMTNEIK